MPTPEPVRIPVQQLPHAKGLPLPVFATAGAAGADCLAAVQSPLVVPPMQVALVPTGLRFAIPEGFEIQVRPRSGLALKKQVTLLNTPGTIDSDYRGEVQVILMNFGPEPFRIERGDRIAQLVLARVERPEWLPVAELDETERGAGGFGSTGVKL
ncbi:MAG: dUTP diphosphatase [Candidatus Sumerlaeia bacterium]|nr:dUTP diphosphatase [Candidatus Sumerlaeia bacterium]